MVQEPPLRVCCGGRMGGGFGETAESGPTVRALYHTGGRRSLGLELVRRSEGECGAGNGWGGGGSGSPDGAKIFLSQ